MCGWNCHTWSGQIHCRSAEVMAISFYSSQASTLKIGERWWPIWGIITKDKKRQLCFGHIFLRYVKIWLKSCRRNDRESRLSIDTHIPVGVGTCLWQEPVTLHQGECFPYRRDGLALNQDVSASALVMFWRSLFILGDCLSIEGCLASLLASP